MNKSSIIGGFDSAINHLSCRLLRLFGPPQQSIDSSTTVNHYHSTWSILIQWSRHILSGDNLVYTTESVLPVCDKLYLRNNGFQQIWTDIKKMWNHALAARNVK